MRNDRGEGGWPSPRVNRGHILRAGGREHMEFDIRTGELSAAELEGNFDFDYSVGEVFIDSMETFRRELLEPFRDKERHIFYRGERVGD